MAKLFFQNFHEKNQGLFKQDFSDRQVNHFLKRLEPKLVNNHLKLPSNEGYAKYDEL